MANGEAFGIPQGGFVLSRMFRSACEGCQSRDLRWSSAEELLERLTQHSREALEDGEIADLRHIMTHCAPTDDAWQCRACGQYGVMSGIESGFF